MFLDRNQTSHTIADKKVLRLLRSVAPVICRASAAASSLAATKALMPSQSVTLSSPTTSAKKLRGDRP